MSTTSNTITIGIKTAAAFWDEFAASRKEQTPPAGSMSARAFSEKYGIPLNSAKCLLVAEVDAGTMTTVRCRQLVKGCMREIDFYVPVPQSKPKRSGAK